MNAPQPGSALQARQLEVVLGHGRQARPVVRQLDLDLRAACWTSIVGPNGAGKSTLLRALAGLLPARGQVQLLGRELHAWKGAARARCLAWLAQGGANETGVDDLTVHDVALLGRLPHQGWLAPPSPRDLAVVEEALRRTHAWDWRERCMGELSGGERQRVLLARLLSVEASVLLMDEPLANLDPPHQSDWIGLVRELVHQGKTVVTVLHELSIALLADELVVMNGGRLDYAGPTAAPGAHQALVNVFEGRISIHRLADRWVALPC